MTGGMKQFGGKYSHEVGQCAQVRKTPILPRSWANSSLSSLHSHRNAWASSCIFWANLTPFSLQACPDLKIGQTLSDLNVTGLKIGADGKSFTATVELGLGRIVALCYCSSTSYQIC